MTAPAASTPDLHALVDAAAIVDALYRFGAGQDLDDRALFASAFTEDATLDFTRPAARLGVPLPVFEGRAAIVDTIMGTVARLDTTHTVTNPRVTVDGDRASLFALVEAMHLPRDDHRRHLRLKNVYRVELARGRDGWAMRRVVITNVWMDGDARVLFPDAPANGGA